MSGERVGERVGEGGCPERTWVGRDILCAILLATLPNTFVYDCRSVCSNTEYLRSMTSSTLRLQLFFNIFSLRALNDMLKYGSPI